VKLNEATNFTILMPDQRGHGQNPSVNYTSFGSCEADDALSAIQFLRNLKTPEQLPVVGKEIGIYGLEMGGLAGLMAATQDDSIKALALDSVPASTEVMVASTVEKRYPFGSAVTSKFAQYGTRPYFYQGCYRGETSCESAKQLAGRKVLLLGGLDAPDFQESTSKLSKCFPAGASVESRTDLSPSGFSIINASLELSEAYDQRVIDFFRQALAQI
jgi:pimeloyl-ACP methyl ester carboxylesterase